ncbi:MAG: CRISPR-associated endonuclease Cas1 [Deltaproteobacteria bacterium]|jgi:CRISPR-associated protein Cas1|nr:CRISPR-associated endonuclease Cas1 [Deltaproteobacteria bacterium]
MCDNLNSDNFLSARNVAEYAYCPRLFYLMQAENQFIPSVDTEIGKIFHKDVDKPSIISPQAEKNDYDKPVTVSGLVLSSQKLGVIAVLDLAELDGLKAVPIEYRKGRPKKCRMESGGQIENTIQPWPVDLIQVGLQVIVLEEAGYIVSEAALYYGEENIKLTIPVDCNLKTEALKILDDAKKCLEGSRPLPLVNDTRCPRCSLYQICLPYEVNFNQNTDSSSSQPTKKLWPLREDGIHVVSQNEGFKIGISGLELKISDKDGKVTKKIPIINIDSLTIVGMVQISTQAIQVLTEKQIPITFISSAGRLLAVISPQYAISSLVRRSQVLQFNQPDKCLELAKALIYAKILNQRTILMRNSKNVSENIFNELLMVSKKSKDASSINELRGFEGYAASIYFKYFPDIIHSKSLATQFLDNGRKRRPPPDPVNAALSLAYSVLTRECISALLLASLEPTIGSYHVSTPGRPALALDLMEPFRPLISDSVVITCFNKNELTEGHFLKTSAGYTMTKYGLKAFFSALHRRMETEISHNVFNYKLSYRRMLILHAKMVAAWLVGDIKDLSFLITR